MRILPLIVAMAVTVFATGFTAPNYYNPNDPLRKWARESAHKICVEHYTGAEYTECMDLVQFNLIMKILMKMEQEIKDEEGIWM